MASLADLLAYSQNLAKKYTSLDTPQDQTLGETLGDVALGFVPVVGTAQAARDFVRAERENDRLGMGLSAASVLPVAGGFVKAGRTATKASKIAKALEQVTPKEIGKDLVGRPILDFRGSTVSHFTDPESAKDIYDNGYKVVGEGYYGDAVSFTPNREYGKQFGGIETKGKISNDANILNHGIPEQSELISQVLRKNVGANPKPGQKTWRQAFLDMGVDGIYDPGAGDLFIFNPNKVTPVK